MSFKKRLETKASEEKSRSEKERLANINSQKAQAEEERLRKAKAAQELFEANQPDPALVHLTQHPDLTDALYEYCKMLANHIGTLKKGSSFSSVQNVTVVTTRGRSNINVEVQWDSIRYEIIGWKSVKKVSHCSRKWMIIEFKKLSKKGILVHDWGYAEYPDEPGGTYSFIPKTQTFENLDGLLDFLASVIVKKSPRVYLTPDDRDFEGGRIKDFLY